MFDVAALGRTMIFMFATAAQVVVGLYVGGYAAHCFLVVLDGTAAGNDEVVWPDEPFLDWLWKLFYLAWLVGFWLVPAWLLAGVAGPALAAHFPGLSLGQLLVGVVWLLFPVGLFSSLSANSLWVVFRPEVLRRFAHHLPAVLVVYVMTGALVVGWGWLAHLALERSLLLLPVAAFAGAAVLLIDARLLGRLSWLLSYRTPERRRRRKAKQEPPAAKPVAVVDPWELPPEAKRPKKKKPRGAKTKRPAGYTLMPDESSAPPPAAAAKDDAEPLAMQPLPPDDTAPTDAGPKEHPLAHLAEVSEFEAKLAGPPEEPEPPAHPLWSGVYQFPWYPRTLGAWLWLSFGGLVVGAFLKLQIMFWPG
jgi:hypothetical protein